MTPSSMHKAMAELHQLEWVTVLMEVDESQRDLEWLRCSLQTAISVELFTIPPYLTALWSIKDERDEAAASVRSVVQEEMLHMALACNMLTAIGGVPRISDPQTVPIYPGPLPGGIHKGLTVKLARLCDASLDGFIKIESPARVVDGPDDETIGEFYDGVLRAFRALKPQLSLDRQISGSLAHMVIVDGGSFASAVELIKSQGEGSKASPVVEHSTELAHYYRFLEIRRGRRLSGLDDCGNAVFDGPPVPRPDCWPMATIPDGGYRQQDVPPGVWSQLHAFDVGFTRLLNGLQAMWEQGDQGALIHGIETMFGLTKTARELMQIPIGDGPETYGPCFRLLPTV